jgi:hypothetical protein
MIEDFDPNAPSRGLGDTIAKFTHATGIAKAVEVVTEALGIEDCGCGGRQEWANNLVPYDVESNSPPIYNPNNQPPAETGVYDVLHQIHVIKKGEQINFFPGDKILMTEEHLLYSDWPYYILIGAVKKTT